MALARLGRFKLGVYVWGLLSSCVIALIPLATSGLAGIEVECAVLNLLVIALFISPRNLKYFIMLLTGTVILAGLLDTFVPWPRLQMTGLPAILRGAAKPSRVFEFHPSDVKRIRASLYQSQAQFARMIGVSVSTLLRDHASRVPGCEGVINMESGK